MKKIIVTFPKLTTKQIVEECDNKAHGGKLLYNTEWYKNEDFYTKETCREGKREVDLEISRLGKTWNEYDEMTRADEDEKEMLNFAEIVYLLRESKEFFDNSHNWTWTSARSSDGILVRVGYADPDGVLVDHDCPRYSRARLGVRFSRSVPLESCDLKSCSPIATDRSNRDLEKRVEKLEAWQKKLIDAWNG